MHINTSNFTLNQLQIDYRNMEQFFRRQAVIAAPGLGKDVLGKTLKKMELDIHQFIFSDAFRAHMKEFPNVKKEIASDMAKGLLAGVNHVRDVYVNNLKSRFNIEKKMENGTVIDDGFPREGGDGNPRNQVNILRDVHGDTGLPVYGLVTIMKHKDSYEPALRQIFRELKHEYQYNEINRNDAEGAAKRVQIYNGLLPNLERDIRLISNKTNVFGGDDNTPEQRAYLYLGMTVTSHTEAELRDTKEYARLGGEEFQFAPLMDDLHILKNNFSIKDRTVAANAEKLEATLKHMYKAQQSGLDFNRYAA